MRARNAVLAVVAALASGVAAAPASAQELPPQCESGLTVPHVVDCAFATAHWVNGDPPPPEWVIDRLEDEFNHHVGTVQDLVEYVGTVLDEPGPPWLMDRLCFVLGIPPDECPQL